MKNFEGKIVFAKTFLWSVIIYGSEAGFFSEKTEINLNL